MEHISNSPYRQDIFLVLTLLIVFTVMYLLFKLDFYFTNKKIDRGVSEELAFKNNLEDVWLKIESFDFSKVLDRLRLEHRSWSEETVQINLLKYKRFLFLVAANSDKKLLAPFSLDMDEVWHAHLELDSYASDCEYFFGTLLKHEKFFDNDVEKEKEKASVLHTNKMHRKYFQIPRNCPQEIKDKYVLGEDINREPFFMFWSKLCKSEETILPYGYLYNFEDHKISDFYKTDKNKASDSGAVIAISAAAGAATCTASCGCGGGC